VCDANFRNAGATWDELDLEAKAWTIPGARMKAGVDHRVPLSDRCVDILKRAKAISDDSRFVFPGRTDKKAPSNMVFLMALRRMKRTNINVGQPFDSQPLRITGNQGYLISFNGDLNTASPTANASGRWEILNAEFGPPEYIWLNPPSGVQPCGAIWANLTANSGRVSLRAR